MLRVRLRVAPVMDALKRRSVSQNYLAMKLEVSPGYFSQLLNGTRCPGPSVRKRLMNELKVKPEEFDSLFERVS